MLLFFSKLELNIAFTAKNSTGTMITITSVTGKQIQTHYIQAQTGSNIVSVDTNEMDSGVYFVQININGASKTIQFVVK